MQSRTTLGAIISGVFLVLVCLPQVFAAECLVLEPRRETPDARGTVTLRDLDNGDLQEVDITVHNLRSEEMYTVWLTAERIDLEEEAGEVEYLFQTDSHGKGSHTDTFSTEDLQREFIEIAFQLDRDSQDMKVLIIHLKTEL